MLVLTRKCQEMIVVGGADGCEPILRITVVGIANGKVRLGLEASTDLPIHRMEIWERIQANGQSANQSLSVNSMKSLEPAGNLPAEQHVRK